MSVKGKEPEHAKETDGVIVVGKMRNPRNAASLGDELLRIADEAIRNGDPGVTVTEHAIIINAVPGKSRPERGARNPRASRRRARSSNG